MTIQKRKDDHIRISLEHDVMASRNFWDDIILPHRALPEKDLNETDLEVDFLGKKLRAPLIISAMTGGTPQAQKYNDMLAKAASEFGIGLGVGSQRAGLENKEYRGSYEVINEYDIPLKLGNIGAPQFSDTIPGIPYGREKIVDAIEMIGADAICIHLNYLQEVVQPEGDCFVSGMKENLSEIAKDFPVVAKETGAGISYRDALLLKKIGVRAIDVGGLSGTTFSGVESFRYDETGHSERLGRTLWDWGIPTPVSIRIADVGLPIIGTGGLRNGLDVARAISLGANVGGMAWKLLMAASRGYESLEKEIKAIITELKSVMFLAGATDVKELMEVDSFAIGPTREILERMVSKR
jgi:isopentenyl-diphosphate delta-isomerase